MIAVLDHRDSFTHNLVHLLHGVDSVRVFGPDETDRLDPARFTAVVFSPGPGRPEDYPSSLRLYKEARGRLPILGVCLGFQLILHAEGARTIRQHPVLHGVQTPIRIKPGSRAYRGLPDALRVGRYHSLQVDPESLPPHVRVTGWDTQAPIPLSFDIPRLDIHGFQYHPDSFLTDHGQQILTNCLRGGVES